MPVCGKLSSRWFSAEGVMLPVFSVKLYCFHADETPLIAAVATACPVVSLTSETPMLPVPSVFAYSEPV